MTRRINGDALENRSGAAATGNVFTFDDAHVDGGTWQAPAAGSQAFPVGSIFFAAVSTNPATLLGYGTWSAIGAGRVLVGQDTGDTNFDVLGETGGAKTSSHTHPAGTLTTDTFAAHTHGAGTLAPSAHVAATVLDHSSHAHQIRTSGSATISAHSSTVVAAHSASDFNHKHDITTSGNATISAHPSHGHGSTQIKDIREASAYSIYDTATTLSAHTLGGGTEFLPGISSDITHAGHVHSDHTLGGDTEGPTLPLSHASHTHDAHTMSGSTASDGAHNHAVNSGSTGSTASSTVQPYLVVAIWQRTA